MDLSILSNNIYTAGLLVLEEEDTSNIVLSEDSKMPNRHFSFLLNNTFNKVGKNYAFKDWAFPVALIRSNYPKAQKYIKSCYEKFNINPTSKFRCSAKIKNFMAATNNALDCARKTHLNQLVVSSFETKQMCHQITGTNFMMPARLNVTSRSPDSVLVLVTRMDSLSLFERAGIDVHGELTSTALQLTVMWHLMRQPEFETGKKLKKDVLFLYLDNEAYDYLGSSTFLEFLKKKKNKDQRFGQTSPMSIENIEFMLEFGELGFANFNDLSYFFQTSFQNKTYGDVQTRLLKQLSSQLIKFGYSPPIKRPQLGLPPSSLQFLLRGVKKPAVVLADHAASFHNSQYHSFLDTAQSSSNSSDNASTSRPASGEQLLGIANAVAAFLFQECTGKALNNTLSANDIFTPEKIISCFAKNITCDAIRKTMTDSNLIPYIGLSMPIPGQFHVGTVDYPIAYRISNMLYPLISLLSGPPVNMSLCNNDNYGIIQNNNGSTCHLKRVVLDAVETISLDGEGPIWLISSVEGGRSVEVFVEAPNRGLLAAGLVITFVALLLVGLTAPRLSLLFTEIGSNSV